MATVPFQEALRVWIRIALHSFGGPAGQIAVMHKVLVEEKQWISERRFLHALNYCMLLPGPEAMQMVTYIGWLLHGVRGGLVAGALFVLPGFLSILALSIAYALYQDATAVAALLFGLKAAVLAVVVQAVVRLGTRALHGAAMVLLAAAAFVAIFLFDVPFPFIILAAALVGFLGGRRRPDLFGVRPAHDDGDDAGAANASGGGPLLGDGASEQNRPSRARSLCVAATWLLVWWVPVGLLALMFGVSHVFVQEAWFFSQASVVTFGGAYAVLAYIAQRAVEDFGWLAPDEMLDGLGMAEATPGPLIQVVQFVAFMGAFRNPGAFDPVTAGILASVIVTWVTFVPCFLWIFLGAPFIEHLRGKKGLTDALAAVTAAVVGVILNLAVWFALHVLFPDLQERSYGPLTVLVPTAAVDLAALTIAAGALVALLRFKWNLLAVLATGAAAGIGYRLLI
ncbi:MAG: chromate efflux transporter [Thermoplasmatota archaeon]